MRGQPFATREREGVHVQKSSWDAEAELERRLDLVTRPENAGEDMRSMDYALLLAATLVLPVVIMIAGWFL